MISKEKLDDITDFLKWNVFRNSDIMFLEAPGIPLKKPLTDKFDGEPIKEVDLVDVIASLHNLLYEAVTGERYDYMFHWANKVGSDCVDNIFDDDISEGTLKENHISIEEYLASCHGRWSECYTDSHHYSGICSVCGKASIKSLTESLYKYCPKCGARMDGDTNDKA